MMTNSAAIAILICLEFVQPKGFDENCQTMVERAIPHMEQFDLLPKEQQAKEERRVSHMALLHVQGVCQQHKPEVQEECIKSGLSLAKMIWDGILAAAAELRKSHTA